MEFSLSVMVNREHCQSMAERAFQRSNCSTRMSLGAM